jgi:hypothetical protein
MNADSLSALHKSNFPEAHERVRSRQLRPRRRTMTNTESRIAVELEELAPWDAEALENDESPLTEADRRELAVYGFDSEQRTLVGLGPVERARRSRAAAEIPENDRMPQSQPPGPFIAADEEVDDVVALSARPWRSLPRWALAAPAAVVAVLAVASLWGLTRAHPASKPAAAVAAVAPPVVVGPELKQPQEDTAANEQREPEAAADRVEEPLHGASANAPSAATASAPTTSAPVAAALAVKLAELPAPTVTDMAGGAVPSAGTLNVTSNPPANVLLDGRPLGKAPRIVQVPPGPHTVLFIHPLYGRQSLKVNVSPGRATSASANF